jgi:phospholipid/cholesterol/gamma-HCH transport system substrate-binding protein
MSGIKIGSVLDQRLDPETYLAVVRLSIADAVRLPLDSSAKIQSEPARQQLHFARARRRRAAIEPGGEIRYTQDPLILGDLIGRFIFGGAEQKPGAAEGPPAQP